MDRDSGLLAVLVAATVIAHCPRMLDDPHAGVWIGLLLAVFAGCAAAPRSAPQAAAAATHMVMNVALGLGGGVLYALRRGTGR